MRTVWAAFISVALSLAAAFPMTSAGAAATCAGRRATITGTSGNDELRGTGRADVIFAGAGRDYVLGLGGNDVICGGRGPDELVGGNANDRLLGGRGVDFLKGERDNDVLVGGGGRSHILMGGAGDDRITGGSGIGDVVDYQSSGSEVTVNLSAGTATGEGDDTLAAIDVVIGTPFNDSLTGDDRPNLLAGRDGDDALLSGGGGILSGPTPFLGAFGRADVLLGEGGNDSLTGGEGFDVAMFFDAPTAVTVNLRDGTATGDGTDALANIEGVHSSRNGDTLIGDEGDNAFALSANGHDVDGGAGRDLVFFTYALDNQGRQIGVTVDLAAGTATGQGSTMLRAIEGIWGTPGPDRITGDQGPNLLNGREGNDVLRGAEGDDMLRGGAGDDEGDGGPGNDTCEGVEERINCET